MENFHLVRSWKGKSPEDEIVITHNGTLEPFLASPGGTKHGEACPFGANGIFRGLSSDAEKRLSTTISRAIYPKGTILFAEGQHPQGLTIVCCGRTKVYTSTSDSSAMIVRTSEPCELLGLAATISGKPYECTAQLLERAEVRVIPRDDFLMCLNSIVEVAVRVAGALSESYHVVFAELKKMGPPLSARTRLARLLLDWSSNVSSGKGEIELHTKLTHEEIAELIGSSRETVTRLFAAFKKKQLIRAKGPTLTIRDRAALENLVKDKMRG